MRDRPPHPSSPARNGYLLSEVTREQARAGHRTASSGCLAGGSPWSRSPRGDNRCAGLAELRSEAKVERLGGGAPGAGRDEKCRPWPPGGKSQGEPVSERTSCSPARRVSRSSGPIFVLAERPGLIRKQRGNESRSDLIRSARGPTLVRRRTCVSSEKCNNNSERRRNGLIKR